MSPTDFKELVVKTFGGQATTYLNEILIENGEYRIKFWCSTTTEVIDAVSIDHITKIGDVRIGSFTRPFHVGCKWEETLSWLIETILTHYATA